MGIIGHIAKTENAQENTASWLFLSGDMHVLS
jgi:hypothetical protein